MKTTIKTTFPCIIKKDIETFEFDPNEILEVDSDEILFVYPLNQKNQIPFCIKTNSLHSCAFYDHFVIDSKNLIVFKCQNQFTVSHKEKMTVSGKDCTISIASNNLRFETETKIVECECVHPCLNYKLSKIKNFICLDFDKDVYLFDVSKGKLNHINGDEVNIQNNKIDVKKRMNDSESRIKTCSYIIDGEIKKDLVHFLSETSHIQDPNLIPFKILESAKANDSNYIENCLQEPLKSQLNAEQIKSFFGNIKQFLPLSTTEFILLSSNKYKYVKFEIAKDKVCDISIDDLT